MGADWERGAVSLRVQSFIWTGGMGLSDLLQCIGTIVNNNIYFKIAKKIDFKCYHDKIMLRM